LHWVIPHIRSITYATHLLGHLSFYATTLWFVGEIQQDFWATLSLEFPGYFARGVLEGVLFFEEGVDFHHVSVTYQVGTIN